MLLCIHTMMTLITAFLPTITTNEHTPNPSSISSPCVPVWPNNNNKMALLSPVFLPAWSPAPDSFATTPNWSVDTTPHPYPIVPSLGAAGPSCTWPWPKLLPARPVPARTGVPTSDRTRRRTTDNTLRRYPFGIVSRPVCDKLSGTCRENGLASSLLVVLSLLRCCPPARQMMKTTMTNHHPTAQMRPSRLQDESSPSGHWQKPTTCAGISGIVYSY